MLIYDVRIFLLFTLFLTYGNLTFSQDSYNPLPYKTENNNKPTKTENKNDTIPPPVLKDEQNQIEQNIENIIEGNDNPDLDYTNLLDALSSFRQNKINLNKTSPDELRELGLLSDLQIASLFRHIQSNGKLIVIYELQSIDGFNKEDIEKILPFVYVSDRFKSLNISFDELWKYGKNSIDIRTQRILEDQVGFSPISDSLLNLNPNSRYLGDPYRHFFRYRFNYNNKIQWGFTGEKDAGEEFFRGSQPNGFDFYSGYVSLRNVGKLKSLNIGDFHAQFGQGLILWTDLAFGKTTDIIQFKRSAKGMRAYNSINENQYLRGAGVTYEVIKNVEVSLIGSRKFRDATVNTSTDTTDAFAADEFTNFQLTGFHRTPNELESRNSLREDLLAGNISYKTKNLMLGITGVNINYNKDFAQSTRLYNLYNFSGRNLANAGFDFNYIYRNINLYGEHARSSNGGNATVAGALVSLDPKFFIHILYRNYSKDYQTIYTRGVGETVGTQNEKGILTGFNFKPKQTLTFSGYIDRFEFPFVRFRLDIPSSGYDFLFLADWSPTKKIQLNARYRKRLRPRNLSGSETPINQIAEVEQDNYRFNFVYSILPGLRLKNRLEINNVDAGNGIKRAYMVYQDINFKPKNTKLSFTARYALFDAPDFDARVFMLETDVPYSFSFPSLIGRGQRFYAMINYDVSRNLEVWVRYAQTYYEGESILNRGTLNESNGPLRSELKLHLRYKF